MNKYILLALFLASAARATSLPPLSMNEWAEHAPVWVYARAEASLQSSAVEREQRLTVIQVYRGVVKGKTLRLRLPGGTERWVPGSPQLLAGQDYMLLLRPSAQDSQVFEPVGLSLGVQAASGPDAAAQVLRLWQGAGN